MVFLDTYLLYKSCRNGANDFLGPNEFFEELADKMIDGDLVTSKMKTLQLLGDPYTDEQIAGAKAAVEGRSEMDALIAYLQELGTNRSARR